MAKLRKAVIVDYLRSPISRSRPRDPDRDCFNNLRMDNVLADLIIELLKRNRLKGEDVTEALIGCAQPWDEQSQFGGKFALYAAKLPFSVSAMHIDKQCGSSIATVNVGAMEIMLGYSDIVISGGMEHMTHVPMPGPDTKPEDLRIKPNNRFFEDPDFQKFDFMTIMSMGLTAEKLAQHAGFTRKELDEFATRSHRLAAKGYADGFFKDEIMPVPAKQADGTVKIIDTDQSLRGDTTLEGLAGLKPSFRPDGLITAGNASPLNAAATAIIMMSEDKAKELKLKPMATIYSMGWAGVDPTMMGMGPVPASRHALKNAGLTVKDIDYWEINEAFAVVPLYAIRELKIDPERVNIHGGGVALGHPLGATGNRLVGTLARILEEKKATYGIATPCIGGGQGVATVIKREKY